MCPRVTFACPPCGHMESASATHGLRLTAQTRGRLSEGDRPAGRLQRHSTVTNAADSAIFEAAA